MNKNILNTEVQEFINQNLDKDVSSLLLKGINLDGVSTKEVVTQIEAKNKTKKKLPSWYKTEGIYYPNKLNIEQTSSEITAEYKASLVSGKKIIDATGGFGVDSYHFSNSFEEVYHCEINSDLSKIATHNFKALKKGNIHSKAEDGIVFIENSKETFDCIFVDPSRRDSTKNKVFLLQDCAPNMRLVLPTLFKKAKIILVKTSPLLDLSKGIEELNKVAEIHIVAVNNEVKELLWLLKSNVLQRRIIKTINISKSKKEVFEFEMNDESSSVANFSAPLDFLYEPNAAILKSGGFNIIADKLNLSKLHPNTHLYTSNELVADFPGRTFIIKNILSYNKIELKKVLTNNKANITTRNFPETVAQIRKKTKIQDGGNTYLFFCTNHRNDKIVLHCEKA
ncbi:class I SAM-dependent methyltransferase [Joostella atrarenae]|uniref:Class I SAM-dependent methyltransferase n=1 Tax=Joostella atrarenae TaxID=679257 RepID=A0ABS9J3W4_9FLAO|nr:class I SAM-dependent methyltransferase [Joostella atrarenae]MCF8715131.1 class I SAM-dependent methyltransferase [Joostella atrarenae]